MDKLISDYIDHQEKNRDYIQLIEEYSNTEIYKETIHFMNWFYPEWNSNYGIGQYAAEFILTTIENVKSSEVYNSDSTFLFLKELYSEIVDGYKECKKVCKFSLSERIYQNFIEKHNDESELNNLSELKYNQLYNEFSASEMKKTCYTF